MNKFNESYARLAQGNLDLGYMAKRLASKMRGVLRFFNIVQFAPTVLKDHPELLQMQMDLLSEERSADEIGEELKKFFATNPAVLDEAVVEAKRNVQDFPVDDLAIILSTAAEYEPEEDIKAMLVQLRDDYGANPSDALLRQGIDEILDREIENLKQSTRPDVSRIVTKV